MKRSDLVFASLLPPIDFCMMTAAGLAAYFLRFQALSDIRPVVYEIPLSRYVGTVIGVACVTVLFFAAAGLYRIGHRRIPNEIQKIVSAFSMSIMTVIVFIFFIKELFSSRFIVLAAWILGMCFVILGRALLRLFQNILFRWSVGLHPIALIGDKKSLVDIVQVIRDRPSLGYKIMCQSDVFDEKTQRILEQLAKNNQLDELFVMQSGIAQGDLMTLMNFAQVNHIGIRYSADIIGGKNLEIGMIAGIPLVEVKQTRLEGWGKISKRCFDIASSIVLIIICLPLYILIAVLIKIDSRGPVIYKNRRVGQRGLFTTYKFRTMKIECCTGDGYDDSGAAAKYQKKLVLERSERKGPVFKVLNDPRRTRLGSFLERTSLDELPQFFNVFLGNMSLVGPRPHMPEEVAGYGTHHHQLFSVKPGVTGLAQISGRSDLDFDDEASLDIFYIEQWSFLFDLIILAKTPLAVISRKSRV